MSLLDGLHAHLERLAPGPLAVGLSGGMDSTVLLHALAHTPVARARGLRAVHIDHGLHADSRAWAEHCRAFAQVLDVDVVAIAAQVERTPRMGLEDAARRARFAAFAQALRPGEILALAQHRGDQAETVLLKLLRGAGPEGLAGMRVLRPLANGLLWRPLLDVPRAQLHAYALTHKLDWIEDPSNARTDLSRNFLRHEILPRLGQQWSQAEAALAHSATWQRAAADYIDAQAASALATLRGTDPATLDWRGWLALPDALRDPVLRRWLRACALDEPNHFHVVELERQLLAAPDRHPSVTFASTQLRRIRDRLHATRRDETDATSRTD